MRRFPLAGGYLPLALSHLEVCLLSPPFGMLEGIRQRHPDGAQMFVRVCNSGAELFIPKSFITEIVSAAPGNPHEIDLQRIAAEILATNPTLEDPATATTAGAESPAEVDTKSLN